MQLGFEFAPVSAAAIALDRFAVRPAATLARTHSTDKRRRIWEVPFSLGYRRPPYMRLCGAREVFSPARAPGPFSRLGDLDDGLHRRRMNLADDREPAPRPERVAVGLALAGQHPRREALALHVVRRAVAPGPLDRAAPMG